MFIFVEWEHRRKMEAEFENRNFGLSFSNTEHVYLLILCLVNESSWAIITIKSVLIDIKCS